MNYQDKFLTIWDAPVTSAAQEKSQAKRSAACQQASIFGAERSVPNDLGQHEKQNRQLTQRAASGRIAKEGKHHNEHHIMSSGSRQ